MSDIVIKAHKHKKNQLTKQFEIITTLINGNNTDIISYKHLQCARYSRAEALGEIL